MKFLLDENIPNSFKTELEKLGYKDIKRINDIKKGITDKEVFDYAQKEERAIITIDTDFYEWKKDKHFGIVSLSGKLITPIKTMIQAIKQIKKDDRFKTVEDLNNIFIRITNMEFIVGRKIRSRYKEVKCKYKKNS